MQIALASGDDWQNWRQLRLAALADAPQAFGSRYDDWVQAAEARWRTRLSHGSNWIASLAEPCGMVSGMPSGRVVELIGLWVAPNARRLGVGEALIEQVLDWTRGTQATHVELEVKRDNLAARRLYERRGFRFARCDDAAEDVLTLAM